MDGKESLPYLGEAKWSHKRMVKVLALGYWTVRPVTSGSKLIQAGD